MKGIVFIACSSDGMIATKDGGIDWLNEAVANGGSLDEIGDMGFADFLSTVDAMVMGRKTFEKIASMNLTLEQWPYGDIPVYVLSKTLKVIPQNMPQSVSFFSGGPDALADLLKTQGYQRVYVDGGQTIQHYLRSELIKEMVITEVPVQVGDGIPLFEDQQMLVDFALTNTLKFPNGFVQNHYLRKADLHH